MRSATKAALHAPRNGVLTHDRGPARRENPAIGGDATTAHGVSPCDRRRRHAFIHGDVPRSQPFTRRTPRASAPPPTIRARTGREVAPIAAFPPLYTGC